jgi:hypothetical protein
VIEGDDEPDIEIERYCMQNGVLGIFFFFFLNLFLDECSIRFSGLLRDEVDEKNLSDEELEETEFEESNKLSDAEESMRPD